ncbi:MAG TPA: hypothetical protein VL974_09740 [Magnetospirillum sp.]|jgi:hypothetical protein|nr:hypothetical protein [Magnetospirillum sp.]
MSDPGWPWSEPSLPPDEDDRLRLARLFARLFAGADGEAAMEYLAQLTTARCLGAEASDAALRMLEGQRQLVLHLQSLIRRGRDGR